MDFFKDKNPLAQASKLAKKDSLNKSGKKSSPKKQEAVVEKSVEELGSTVVVPKQDMPVSDVDEHNTGVGPIPEGFRVWTDINGEHKTVAKFLDLKDGNVRLMKRGETFIQGPVITVPLNSLSKEDQQSVDLALHPKQAQSAVEPPPPPIPAPPAPMPKGKMEQKSDIALLMDKQIELEKKRAEHTAWTIGVGQEIIQGELVNFIGNDVVLMDVKRFNGVTWVLVGNTSFKLGTFCIADQTYLKDFRKLENEIQRLQRRTHR